MNGVLARIVRETKDDLKARKAAVTLSAMEARARRTPKTGTFAAAVRGPGVRVIAELKSRSPSAGPLRDPYDPGAFAKEYARAGAAAISVLTEPHYFGGDLSHLAMAGKAGLPVLRKDFIVDPYQVFEARANGADAVLLIVRILTDAELRELLGIVEFMAFDALVEAHDAAELERALAAGARIVGVNCRDLDTLTVDKSVFDRLIPSIPKDRTIVAESGIKTAADVQRLRGLGANAILVGESLLRHADLEAAARALVDAGR